MMQIDFNPLADAVDPVDPPAAPAPTILPGFDPGGMVSAAVASAAPLHGMGVGMRGLPWVLSLRDCRACTCRAEAGQVVPAVGPLDAQILLLGQNPGEEEDLQGEPFLGAGGEELTGWLRILGLRRERLALTYAVKCFTARSRVPTAKEQKTCTQCWLGEEIAGLPQLQAIIPLGRPAAVAVLGKAAPPLTPLMAHHQRVRINGRELRVFPLPHPAFLLRSRHFKPLMYETVLVHLKLTLQQEVPEAYAGASGL